MKIDYDLIVGAPTTLNPLGQRELSLRGLRIPQIENLILTKNQYDCLDLTDNDIRRLGNFPLLPRLETLLLANNRVSRIETEMAEKLPGLSALVLTNNELAELGDLLPLSGAPALSVLCLHDNPVALKKHYRDFVIQSLPKVKVLDFQRVTETERENARKLFSGPKGTELLAALSATLTGTGPTAVGLEGAEGEGEEVSSKKGPSVYRGPSPEEVRRIQEALKSAKTLDEITRLERQLQTGGQILHPQR